MKSIGLKLMQTFWSIAIEVVNQFPIGDTMDRIWGIGMGKDNPNVENPLKWRGKNLLGFALTEVRDKLLQKN